MGTPGRVATMTVYDSVERGAADECEPLRGRRTRTFTLTQLLVACVAVFGCTLATTTVVNTHRGLANFDDDHPGVAQLGLGWWRFKPKPKPKPPPPSSLCHAENEKLKAGNEKLKAENNELKKHCSVDAEEEAVEEEAADAEEEAVDPEGEDVEEEAVVAEEEAAVDPEGEDVEEEAVDAEEEAAVDPEGEDVEEEAFVQTNNTAVRDHRCIARCSDDACFCQGLGTESRRGASVDECKGTCASHPGCVGFNYYRARHSPDRWKCEFLTCYLHTTIANHGGCWTGRSVISPMLQKDLYLKSH